jgi:hypothetical protein
VGEVREGEGAMARGEGEEGDAEEAGAAAVKKNEDFSDARPVQSTMTSGRTGL